MLDVSGKAETRDVLIVVYDGVQLLNVAGPLDVFDRAEYEAEPGYRVRLASVGGRPVTTTARTRLGVSADLARVRKPPDTLVVAGGRGYAVAASDGDLVRHVRRLAGGARRTGSVCTGAFVLAEAGLLDGRRATTHWASCADLAAAYPAVSVEPDAIFVRDGHVLTSAGVTAGIDLTLALLEDDFGPEAARAVAKHLVVFMQRPGGQSQFSTWTRRDPPRGGALRDLVEDIDAHPDGDLSVPALAARLGMSRRHFSRLFSQQIGISPGAYVERARVAAARTLLESTAGTVDTIAGQCGFGTVETMRRAFVRETGVSPAAYRERFRRG
ncbi:GlxA family transcriptional regulator [Streptomyces sp. NPDC049555]|uniref:GlxA family transcriptional regulator n=1 Tax=unclassified Streptomyces TaxID=2593676 RepID=UPI003431E0D1